MKLNLSKFDMRQVEDGCTCLFIGKRNTGKSVLLTDLMRYHCDWPIGVVISGTERANHHFEKFIPKCLIYDEFKPELLRTFIERQEKITDDRDMEIKKYGRSDIDNRAFLILDDCLYDKSWIANKDIRNIFYNGRHFGIQFLMTSQYAMGIPPNFRNNIDFVFINRENIIKNRERLYNQYAGMFPTLQVFSQVMQACTQNYECLVINNRTQSNKLEDQVFWYKAEVGINFKVCSRELWHLQEQHDERKALGMVEECDDEPEYDPNLLVVKKGPIINVRKNKDRNYRTTF